MFGTDSQSLRDDLRCLIVRKLVHADHHVVENRIVPFAPPDTAAEVSPGTVGGVYGAHGLVPVLALELDHVVDAQFAAGYNPDVQGVGQNKVRAAAEDDRVAKTGQSAVWSA